MARRSDLLAEDLARRLKQINASRRRVEELFARGLLSRRATEHMYEGLFLNAHRAFEGFVEDLFVGLLVQGRGLHSIRPDVQPRVIVKSHNVARELIIGPRGKYVDWLPYERTMELAHLFFRGGRPFSSLSSASKSQVNASVILRNAIAHRSKHAQEKFEKSVVGGTCLAPGQRTPAGFLRDIYAYNPRQTRYELITAQLLSAARNLAR